MKAEYVMSSRMTARETVQANQWFGGSMGVPKMLLLNRKHDSHSLHSKKSYTLMPYYGWPVVQHKQGISKVLDL